MYRTLCVFLCAAQQDSAPYGKRAFSWPGQEKRDSPQWLTTRKSFGTLVCLWCMLTMMQMELLTEI